MKQLLVIEGSMPRIQLTGRRWELFRHCQTALAWPQNPTLVVLKNTLNKEKIIAGAFLDSGQPTQAVIRESLISLIQMHVFRIKRETQNPGIGKWESFNSP